MKRWISLGLMALVSCAGGSATLRPTRTHADAPRAQWTDARYAPFDAPAYESLATDSIDPDHLDHELVAAAIWVETNAIRQKHGLRALGFSAPCRKAAQQYSDDMVSRDFFLGDHGHPDVERSTPRLRMDAAKLKGATGWGENIAVSFALHYKAGAPFYLPTAPGQPFLDEHEKPLLPHSYASFAQSVVDQWMNSPHHRENILDKDWTHFGAACTAFREKDGFPKLKCTQDFARVLGIAAQ